MNASRSVKLIKSGQGTRIRLRAASTGPNRWSRAVRSWVVEFQERDRHETLPAFDSLFKDDLSDPENTK
jgi:hypothetical protein